SQARGFVVSLSGGCDSAAVACLVALAVRMAWRALGPDGVRARLPQLQFADERDLVARLLTTVYQPTANSSPTTRAAAAALAAAIGARHLVLDVEPMVKAYVDAAATALGRPLEWQGDDLALQNVQARARGPGVWLIANIEG